LRATALASIVALPGAVYLAAVAWTAAGLPFPSVTIPLGAGHSMNPIDVRPSLSLRTYELASSLLAFLTILGLLTGLVTSRMGARLGRGPLIASAVVIVCYLALLASTRFRLSGVSVLVIDNEHSRHEIFHATVVFYGFAWAVWLMAIWTGAGLARLYRLWRRRQIFRSARIDRLPNGR
jgi:hypothetical protein